MQPGRAQPRVLRERLADKRQIGIELGAAAGAPRHGARVQGNGRPDGVMVDAEVGGDRADLPVLAEIEPPDLGVLLGRDHRTPSSTRAGAATRAAPPNGSSDRRPRSTGCRVAAAHRWQGVSRLTRGRGKSDPSRGGGDDRRADGRDDRGGPPGWPGGGPWRPPRSADGPPGDSRPSRTPGRGHRRRRSQTVGDRRGRSSDGAGRPWRGRRRLPRPLDAGADSWHNRRRLSRRRVELEVVTGARRISPGPHLIAVPAAYPSPTLPSTDGSSAVGTPRPFHGGRRGLFEATSPVRFKPPHPSASPAATAPSRRHAPSTAVQISALIRARPHWLSVNELPRVADDSDGLWRRLKQIPFTQRFEGAEDDRGLKETLRAEASGVLAWLVRGCLAWQARGLDAPAGVEDVTATYRRDCDQLGQFLEEACELDPGAEVGATDLYRHYTSWAERSGLGERERLTANHFGRKCGERLRRIRTMTGAVYCGVARRIS